MGFVAGCDVLWGGCPMITLPLERMASRVAASLCYATGLGHEMVVNSQQASSSSVLLDCLLVHTLVSYPRILVAITCSIAYAICFAW